MVGALFFAGKWGLASAGHAFAMWHFDDWQESNEVPDVRMWKWAHEALYRAVLLDTNNAQYRNDLGRLYEFTVIKMTEHPSQIEPLLGIALEQFRATVEQRPSWAMAWANLAFIKHRLGQPDAECLHALDQANRLGASVPSVQQIIAEVAVANWLALSVPQRREMLATIETGLNSQRQRTIAKIIRHYGMDAYFCKILNVESRERICKSRR